MGSINRLILALVVVALASASPSAAVTLTFATGWTGLLSSDDVLQNDLDLKDAVDAIEGAYLPASDLESFSDLITLIGGTCTPNGTKFLRDDGTCQSIPGGGDALVANPLSQFASTTSAQFAGVISNETGTGVVVLATSPTLVTPALGVATATSVTTGDCALATTGLTCAGNSTAGQIMKLLEDTDNGSNFFAIDLGSVNLAGDKTLTPDVNGEFDAENLISDDTVDDGHLDITEEECFPLYTPGSTIADTYDVQSVWRAPVALTITEVWCETDTGTVNLDIQIDDGSPADIMGSDLVCASTAVSDSSSLTGSMAAGDRLDFAITSVASSPTRLTACVVYTR
jgi:hypothetical protein